MLVDYERVLLELKRQVGQKSHHGQRELFALIARLEVEHQIDEGLPEKALRLYGMDFYEEAIRTPGSSGACVPGSDGDQVRASRGDSNPESEEDHHARRGTSTGEHDDHPSGPAANGSAGVTSIVGRRRALD